MKDNPSAWTQMLAELSAQRWPEVDLQLIALVETYGHLMDSERLGNLRIYAQRAHHHLYGMQREVDVLFPWNSSFADPPSLFTSEAAPQPIQSSWQSLREALPTNLRVEDINPGCNQGEKILDELRRCLSEQANEAPKPQFSEAIHWVDELLEKLSQARLSAQALRM